MCRARRRILVTRRGGSGTGSAATSVPLSTPSDRADAASRRLLERINGHRRVVLSSTVVDGRYTLRVCVVSHRTHHDRIAEALEIITAEVKRHTSA